ncbi:MAG: M24 family metallopeptidase [Candidatus Bathyarchaeia archaeon]|nr:aminopeptidase P family protein [Candidatus Bathyarchaeota archaeon]
MKARGCDLALPLPEAEYRDRRRMLDRLMDQLGLQGFVALGSHISYLTGYPRGGEAVYAQARDGDGMLLTPWSGSYLEEEGWRIFCGEVVQVDDLSPVNRLNPSPDYGGVLEVLEGLGRGRIGLARGFEADPILVEALRDRLSRERVLDCSGRLWEARMVKSLREREILKAAFYAVSDSLNEGVKAVEEGVTRGELAGLMADNLYIHGVEALSEGFSAGSGFNPGVLCYPEGEDGALKEGEMVALQVGCRLYGYTAEASRSVIAGGRGPSILMECLDALYRSVEVALETAAPGVSLGRVCEAIREVLGEHWRSRIHGSIHSTGIEAWEPPASRIGESSAGGSLREGMVLSLDLSATPKPGLGILKLKEGLLIHGGGVEKLVTGVISDPLRLRIHEGK